MENGKTTRNSRKRKEKPVEESEIQEGGKKKMHTSADGAEGSEKERPYDNLCPSRVNRNPSLHRAEASTSALSNSGREKGEKGRVSKPNLGFNVTKTMRSEDSKVILVRPIGMEAHTFTSDPVALAQGIGESPFKMIQKSHIRGNKRGNLVTFELEEATIGKLTSLLAVKRLCKWTVNCSQPVSHMQSWGVIKGIHPSVNVEDIKASADYGSSELLSVTRLPRIPPRRCYRCQRLGHVAMNCDSPLRCLVCSGPHTKHECTAEPGQEKCANCHQTHIASSKECPAIRNAAAIQKLQRSGVGFEVAKHKDERSRTNPAGRALEELLDTFPVGIINNDSPTYIDRRVGTTSTLDLFFATHNLVRTSEVRTGPDLGSDPFPVCCTLGVVPVRHPMGAAQHWKLGAADWTKWTSHLNAHTDQTHVGPCNAIRGNNFLLGVLNSAAEKSVPM
ncbi:Zinc finger CCHC-type [Trinorchestia longiramus]|nr:Zinc finger CCHC-type [Trinorchestia longiramus]